MSVFLVLSAFIKRVMVRLLVKEKVRLPGFWIIWSVLFVLGPQAVG